MDGNDVDKELDKGKVQEMLIVSGHRSICSCQNGNRLRLYFLSIRLIDIERRKENRECTAEDRAPKVGVLHTVQPTT